MPETAKPATPEGKAAAEEKSSDKGKGGSGKGDKGHHKGSDTASSKGSGDTKKGTDPYYALFLLPESYQPCAADAMKSSGSKPKSGAAAKKK